LKKLSLVLAFALVFSCVAALPAFSSEEIDRSETVTLTYMYPLGDGFQVVDSMSDNATIKKVNEEKNVVIDFIHPPAGQEAEQYNLMLVSDDLPDMVTHGWGIPQLFPGGADKAIEDGYYLDLKPLIEKYAPNFQAQLADENVQKVASTDGGAIWGMVMIDKTPQPQWCGPAIRKDMFDALDIAIPVTIEDWYNALTKIKAEAPALYPDFEVPLVVDGSGHGDFYAFLGSWDIADTFCLDENGAVVFGPATDAYKSYLTEMAKWYAEGLIQSDFAAGTNRTAYFTGDKTASLATSGFWEYDSWAATAANPDFTAYGTPYPQLVEGQKPKVAYIPSRGHLGYHTAVTTASKNPERAVDWMDWFYSDEGSQLANWGVEGEDFTIQADGSKLYTDKIAHNEEGVAISIIYFKYLYSHGAFLREWDRECPSYGEEANACMWRWLDSTEYSRMIPSFISYSTSEANDFTSIMNDINTYVGEMRVKFITGEESLDNFDAFVETMKTMRLDAATEIQTAAFGRYQSR
jgi:putative aldouronate transport system substrate-binding protein